MFGKDNQKMSGRGWIKETVCNNKNIKFRYDDKRCPYAVQQKCKFFEPIDDKIKEIVTIKNLQDLDDLSDAIRERMKEGPLEGAIEMNQLVIITIDSFGILSADVLHNDRNN